MSILWIDSFDYMGTGSTNLPLRGYAPWGFFPDIVTTTPRTGSHCLATNRFEFQNITRVLDTAVDTCGCGVAIRWTNNQSDSVTSNGIRFGTASNIAQIKVIANGSFGITVYNDNTIIGSSANNKYVTGTWYWLEAKVITGTGTASVEVRLSGETILTITGLTINPITRVTIGKQEFSPQYALFDDFVIWDDSGTTNNDFLGDRRVVTLYPDADTVEADWTPSTGSTGFNLIDEPNPSDADFITANVVGDISEFDKAAIPADVNTVGAVCLVARSFKDSAGTSSFRVGVNSAGNVENSAAFLPNTSVSYFSAIFEQDPNGNIPWTKTAVDNASIRVTREA